jgi:hypothetical protein
MIDMRASDVKLEVAQLREIGDKFILFQHEFCILFQKLFCFCLIFVLFQVGVTGESATDNFVLFTFIQSAIKGFNGDYLFNSFMITSCYVFSHFEDNDKSRIILSPFVAHINY